VTQPFNEYRTCALAGCDTVFGVPSAHPKKIYCTPAHRTRAGVQKKSASTAPIDELELDADNLDDLTSLLAERGLNIDEWVVVRVTVNKWEGFLKNEVNEAVKVPLRQLKVYLRRKVSLDDLVQPAVPLPSRASYAPEADQNDPKLFFIYGDDQYPNADPVFKQLQLSLVLDIQPDEIIDLGDGTDMPTISTHKTDPSNNWTVQECANAYTQWLWELREASPTSRFRILADNHATQRLRDYQLARAADLYGVTPADIAGLEPDLEPLWSLRRLFRLDDLNIEYVEPGSDTHYAESQVELIPGELVAIHGYRTGQNLGKKFLDDYGCSVIYGHQHGQDVYVTDYRRRGIGERKRRFALGVGCGAVIHGGGGFAPGANWSNSALTVSVHSSGHWSFDYVNYEHGTLTWRDHKYTI
jgi:hypothetical protein